MTTVGEVYFLVRVGSWSESELDDYIQSRVDEALDHQHDTVYNTGYEAGQADGLEEGQELMYKEALGAIKCLR